MMPAHLIAYSCDHTTDGSVCRECRAVQDVIGPASSPPWPPLTAEEAQAFRDAKLRELERVNSVLRRQLGGKNLRARLLHEREALIQKLHQVNVLMTNHNRDGWNRLSQSPALHANPAAVRAYDPDGEVPPGYTPMRNADFLLFVARRTRGGAGGPFPRPLVRVRS